MELISISFLGCTLGKQLVIIERCQFLNNIGVSKNNREVIIVNYPVCDYERKMAEYSQYKSSQNS